MKRYQIQSLRGVFEDERAVLTQKARRAKKPGGLLGEPLLNGAHGWKDFLFTPEDQARLEKRDAVAMHASAVRKARGEALPCPMRRYTANYTGASRSQPETLDVSAMIRRSESDIWEDVGGIFAERLHPRAPFIIESSSVDLEMLATCPGLGTGLYEAAAKAACAKGSVIAGSSFRSAFSERFWRRQMTKKRARCGGGEALVYQDPHADLRRKLLGGTITVPQFNDLVRGLPDALGVWKCKNIPLTKCKNESLRGISKKELDGLQRFRRMDRMTSNH